MHAPIPEDAYEAFLRELDLLRSAASTAEPTRRPDSQFFGLPFDDFEEELKRLRDEVEERAYLAIVAAAEGLMQVDIRSRAGEKRSVLLARKASSLVKKEKRDRARLTIDAVLEAWTRRVPWPKGRSGSSSSSYRIVTGLRMAGTSPIPASLSPIRVLPSSACGN